MNKKEIPGTSGYAAVSLKFTAATLAIDFLALHRDFVPFFPEKPGRVLDVGAGIGRDAAAFARMGHYVLAVEPEEALRAVGKKHFDVPGLEWIDDALPHLELLGKPEEQFNFILASGVWHHLDPGEQYLALQRIAGLLALNGVFALTLRNGPTGAGTYVFPTDGKQTVKDAGDFGLTTLLFLERQKSLMKNKAEVHWTRIVFRKPG